MRLLILRLSVSVKALESGSPLYAIGRPAFFLFGACTENKRWENNFEARSSLHPVLVTQAVPSFSVTFRTAFTPCSDLGAT